MNGILQNATFVCKFHKMRYILLFITSFAFSQQISSVDFKTIYASLNINPVKRNVVGNYQATFEVMNPIDTIRIDAQKMEFSKVKINGKDVSHKKNEKQLLLFEGFDKGENSLTFEYEAFPTQTMYFVNWNFTQTYQNPENINGQIWTQGQGKYTSHWLPSFDDVNEKVIYGLDISFHKSFSVISNGVLKDKISEGENIVWKYQMDKPMSSYLVMLAIGHFDKHLLKTKSKIPLELYYETEDSDKREATYRHSIKIFDFLEKEIGIKYPWKVYKQMPVRDFLYAGMENTSATLFSRDYVVDDIGFFDQNYVNVNAHELSHQWFGDLVTAQSGKHHWLQEGFATYYALLAEKEIFGEDHFYYQMYESLKQLETTNVPVLSENASSLIYYQKGAWAIHILRESIGEKKFKKAVKNYLKKYGFKNVVTDDFLAEISAVCDFDVQNFKRKWLEQSSFPKEEALAFLKKNKFMSLYLEKEKDSFPSEEGYLKLLRSKIHYPVKELMIKKMIREDVQNKDEFLLAALQTNDLHVRQAVAININLISENLRPIFETLLNDKSYVTQEIALFKLWKQFPEHRLKYLKSSENWVGFNYKNLRLLHLSLAYLTYQDSNQKNAIYRELLSYTGTNYDSTLQQLALEKLLNLRLTTKEVMKSLVYGTTNPKWQFVKFSKDNIRKLLKEDKNRTIYVEMLPELPIREKTVLQRLLDEK